MSVSVSLQTGHQGSSRRGCVLRWEQYFGGLHVGFVSVWISVLEEDSQKSLKLPGWWRMIFCPSRAKWFSCLCAVGMKRQRQNCEVFSYTEPESYILLGGDAIASSVLMVLGLSGAILWVHDRYSLWILGGNDKDRGSIGSRKPRSILVPGGIVHLRGD